jgi:hypothetical protein
VTHDFAEDLGWSQAASHEPFWQAVYEKAFPDMIANVLAAGDTQAQRHGIDRWIHLSTGKVLAIDEKKRSEDWPDVALEYRHEGKVEMLGWIEKPLLIDFLAYAYMPSKTCLLLPWQLLRRTWLAHRDEWKDLAKQEVKGFKLIKAPNRNYTTHSIGVPKSYLLERLRASQIIDVSRELDSRQCP